MLNLGHLWKLRPRIPDGSLKYQTKQNTKEVIVPGCHGQCTETTRVTRQLGIKWRAVCASTITYDKLVCTKVQSSRRRNDMHLVISVHVQDKGVCSTETRITTPLHVSVSLYYPGLLTLPGHLRSSDQETWRRAQPLTAAPGFGADASDGNRRINNLN